MRNVAVVAPPGAFRMGVASLLDLCGLANRYAAAVYDEVEPARAVEVRRLSLDGGPVTAADGRPLAVDGALEPGQIYDGVFVTGFAADEGAGFTAQLTRAAPLAAWIRAQHDAGAVVAASGPAVFILADAGLLAGGRCAPPWRLERVLRRRHPDVMLEPGPAVVEWARLLTAGAIGAEPDLALRLVEVVLSANLGSVLSKLTRIGAAGDRPGDDRAFASEPPRRDALVGRAQEALQRNFSHRVSQRALASELGVSQRTLLRRFREAVGMSPQAYLQHVRIESAKQMLAKSTRPVERISYMVGYSDAGFFKDVFRREVGMTPAAFRARAQAASE